MGKRSRDKGAAWEREVARMLREAGVPAKRGLGQARSASEVADVHVDGWWCELKCGEPAKYALKALLQAQLAEHESYCRTGQRLHPVAICKADRRGPTATLVERVRGVTMNVTVSLEDWIRIVVAEHKAREVSNG